MHWKPLILALGVALAGAGLLYQYMEQFRLSETGGPKILVVAATKNIDLGDVLTEEMVGAREIPSSYVEERHIRYSDLPEVIGVRVRSQVRANETVLWSDLAVSAGQQRDLSSLIEPNMRAITVRATSTSTFGGLLRPGDRVDVLFTTDREPSQPVTIQLLQNMLVLAVGADIGASEARRASRSGAADQVTLSATTKQAAILTHASSEGSLALVLRNPEDLAVIDDLPVDRNDLIQAEKRTTYRTHEPTTNTENVIPTPIQ